MPYRPMSPFSMTLLPRILLSVLFFIIGTFLCLAIISYSPFDPGWTHVASDTRHVANLMGISGAWFADLLRATLGWGSLIIPVFIFFEVWKLWHKPSILAQPWRMFAQMIACCTLAIICSVIYPDNHLALSDRGGILGYELGLRLMALISYVGTILFLSVLMLFALTLSFGIYWNHTLSALKSLWFFLGDTFYLQKSDEVLLQKHQLQEQKRAEKLRQQQQETPVQAPIVEPNAASEVDEPLSFAEMPKTDDEAAIHTTDYSVHELERLRQQRPSRPTATTSTVQATESVSHQESEIKPKTIQDILNQPLSQPESDSIVETMPTPTPSTVEMPTDTPPTDVTVESTQWQEQSFSTEPLHTSDTMSFNPQQTSPSTDTLNWHDDQTFDELLHAIQTPPVTDQQPQETLSDSPAAFVEPHQAHTEDTVIEPELHTNSVDLTQLIQQRLQKQHSAQDVDQMIESSHLSPFDHASQRILAQAAHQTVRPSSHQTVSNTPDTSSHSSEIHPEPAEHQTFTAPNDDTLVSSPMTAEPSQVETPIATTAHHTPSSHVTPPPATTVSTSFNTTQSALFDDEFDAPLTDAHGRMVSKAVQIAEYRKTLSPLPSLDLLDQPDLTKKVRYSEEQLNQIAELLEIKLKDFNIKATVKDKIIGPVVTRFELELAPGVKSAKVVNISQDLARSLAVRSVRVVPVIAGKSYIGIEIPNKQRETVRLIELLDNDEFRDPKSLLTIAMGKNISGQSVLSDLMKAPHMLVAGTTGSGKSVSVNAMLLTLLLKYTPKQLRLVLIDPKQLELANYNDIPHLLTPVITDMNNAANALNWCVNEMERRYALMAMFRVRKVSDFNQIVETAQARGEDLLDPTWKPEQSATQSRAPRLEPLPLIVIVADEFADMMMQVGKKAEELIARLAQKARAAGIHLLLATQRPSVDVITGLIKANIPTRVALKVGSKIDSRTILDSSGAEDLLGHGDMLFSPNQNEVERLQGPFISDDEVNRICDAWRERGSPNYIEEILYDAESESSSSGFMPSDDDHREVLYDQALEFVLQTRKASASALQRKFSIGYNRAARLIDMMEEQGVIGPAQGSKPREVLM